MGSADNHHHLLRCSADRTLLIPEDIALTTAEAGLSNKAVGEIINLGNKKVTTLNDAPRWY